MCQGQLLLLITKLILGESDELMTPEHLRKNQDKNSASTETGTAKLVYLFDLDGTLVDSMSMHFQAYADVFADMGLKITLEQFLDAAGGPAKQTLHRLRSLVEQEISFSDEEIHSRKQIRLSQILKTTRPKATVMVSLLRSLSSQGSLVGVVSSGSRSSVEELIQVLKIVELLDVIVTGEDVNFGKPHPEPYLLAAKFLGVHPSSCIVFEDHDEGVLSATAAGMSVLQIRTLL